MFRQGLKCPVGIISNTTWPSTCRMSSDHLSRTKNNARQDLVSEAHVKVVNQLSPSVKGISLQVLDPNFTFLAGQWVDVCIPGIKQVGGFSLCSSPTTLKKASLLQLAVKASNSPPAKWVHDQCKPGDRLQLRAGGDVYYSITNNGVQMPDLLLIAGGVGINPLLSILLELKDQKTLNHHESLPRKVTLFFSARTSDELLFQDHFFTLQEALGDCFSFQLFITQQKLNDAAILDQRLLKVLNNKRIQADDIKNALRSCDESRIECFLCGPPGMIDDYRILLLGLGIPDVSIKFEKWW